MIVTDSSHRPSSGPTCSLFLSMYVETQMHALCPTREKAWRHLTCRIIVVINERRLVYYFPSGWIDLCGFVIKKGCLMVLAESKSTYRLVPLFPICPRGLVMGCTPVSWTCVLRSTRLIGGQLSHRTRKGNCLARPLLCEKNKNKRDPGVPPVCC